MATRIAIFVALVILAPWLALSSFLVPLEAEPGQSQIPAGLSIKDLPPPIADAGWDIETYAGLATMFYGRATRGYGDIAVYEWDFDGDGTYDWSSSSRLGATHTYNTEGTYRAIFRVTDEYGLFWTDRIQVSVKTGEGTQKWIRPPARKPKFSRGLQSKDGTVNQYAIIINGAGDERFWTDADTLYKAFHDHLGLDDSHIYFLSFWGLDPWGNEDERIDYIAHLDTIEEVFRRLAEEDSIDADDHLYIMITGHGSYGDPRVQPGDEPDSVESEFYPENEEALGGWHQVWIQPEWNSYKRYRLVSHFDSLYFEKYQEYRSDDDIWIEYLYDYLAGDSVNHNGIIEDSLGEVADFNGNGIIAYDAVADTFDEGDWGEFDKMYDDYSKRLRKIIGLFECCTFDSGLDNTVDIDVVCEDCDSLPDAPVVDGTDANNDGYFDGVDLNSDGDKNDWVSIDEAACLILPDTLPNGDSLPQSSGLVDDHLAELLDSLGERPTLAVFMGCFSGGFIWDLSGPKQVTMTPCTQYTASLGNTFIRNIADPIINPSVADGLDVDGCASMAEVFNYTAERYQKNPQYDDNGDGTGHTDPIPAGGDGAWGRVFFFDDCSTEGYLLYYSHSCSDSLYDDNDAINPGDTVHMSVTLEHTGLTSATAQSVVCTLRTDCSHVTLLDSTASFGDINSSDTATSTDIFSFAVSGSCPDSNKVDFDLYAYTGDTLAGMSAFSQMIYKPYFTIICEPGTLITYHTPLGKERSGKGPPSGINLILTPEEGFGSTVTVSCSGVCSGMNASIVPGEITPPDTSVLFFSLSLFCQPQICSTIVVKATGGGVTCCDTVTHVVRNNPVNDSVFYVSPDGNDLWDGKKDYPLRTIQKGVEWADAGDTVLVAKGTYEEDVKVYKDSIVVTSYYARDDEESYIESTIIDGGGSDPVVRIDTCLEVTLSGFTITNGGSGGIASSGGSGTYVLRNLVWGNDGDGVRMESNSNSQVVSNSISGNTGAGIFYDATTAIFKNNIISHNTHGLFHWNPGASAAMSFNDVWGNTSSNYCSYSGLLDDSTGYNGNMSQDPRYGYFDGGNLHLQFNSPCIDSGDSTDTPPSGGGERIDIGAIEYTCTDTTCGDCNRDCFIDQGDPDYLNAYLFQSGPAPDPEWIGDVDCSGEIDLQDVVYLQNYINGTGQPPCSADSCEH